MDLQFPHCDPRILHKNGECEYCDKHPLWQELRQSWGINFTGHRETKSNEYFDSPMLPCPSEAARPLDTINKWDGNVPVKNGEINEDAPMFEGKKVLHDPVSRHVLTVAVDYRGYCLKCGGCPDPTCTDTRESHTRCDCPQEIDPDPNCSYCNGSGAADSGGETPWGAPISVRCACTFPEYRVTAPTGDPIDDRLFNLQNIVSKALYEIQKLKMLWRKKKSE